MNERYHLMLHWLRERLPAPDFDIAPASSDASFRRYFRVRQGDTSQIVMDAPPAQEDSQPFVTLAAAMAALGLQTPRVLAADLDLGFLLLSDFGSRHFLDELNEITAEPLYADALEALLRLQLGGDPDSPLLPAYDAALLLRELEIFREWFLLQHLQLELTASENRTLDTAFQILCDSALEQPRVWVHRDYHSRNLMITDCDNPGVLDFQGALIGPVTYDLVSLLRDCYIAWPRTQVESWALAHRERLHAAGLPGIDDAPTFLRWFDLMGVQRHLKAIGIFARLWHRDGKPGYLGDIPRTLGYVVEVAARYPQLADLYGLLEARGLTAQVTS
jgi:hypothetical protein